MAEPLRLDRLRQFVTELGSYLAEETREAAILEHGGKLLAALVRHDDWLPADFAQPNPERYQQFLLHADSQQRFSVVSFVWGPGQRTPLHDHRTWGLIGMLRGAEDAQNFVRGAGGDYLPDGPTVRLQPGQVEAVSPTVGDLHQVSNVYSDRVSISIHVYGANIGAVKRAVYLPDGTEKPFISGYSNTLLPNFWGVSNEIHA